MKVGTKWMLFVAVIAACGTETVDTSSPKPAADPDTTVGERADALSNRWTDIAGAITVDGPQIEGEIDYPSWFHGYTIEATAGQELNFQVSATASGPVRLYGPSLGTYRGRPFFTRAAVSEDARPGELTEFVYEVSTSGTYMLVYGPDYVWNASYTIAVQTVGTPSCASDDECAAEEYCGDNGVRCITAPCTANFDICKPREIEGGYCASDRSCADGLTCDANTCTAAVSECATNADCIDEFCGYTSDTSRVCKPFAGEGERCGGFVRPEDYESCGPQHQCLAPDFIADIPGYCGIGVTVDELRNNGATYDGRFVALKGTIDLGVAACTRIGCSISNPCCNQCSGAQEIFTDATTVGGGTGIRLSENGVELSCTGNECNTTESCSTDAGIYWVAGVFDAATATIEVVRKMQGF